VDRLKVIGNKLAVSSSLTSESMPNNPIIEVLGYRRVYIENHKGIAEYGACRIVAKVSYGQICITGKSLELAEMTKSSLVVTGVVECVSLTRNARC